MARKRKREDIERGARLQNARIAAGYDTAAEAADEIGVEYATYNNHEAGWRGITRKKAREYADFYRVNLDWLYENVGQMRGHTATAQPDLLAGLPPHARQEAIDFISYLRMKHGV